MQYAIIIGAAKCGTSSLYAYLAQHPDVCPCKTKEPEYFSEHQAHGLPVDRYEDLWDYSGEKYCLEASTGYTKYPSEQGVAARMKAYGIDAKLIYIMRNPFDRIASHVNHMRDIEGWKRDEAHLITVSNYYLQIQQFDGFDLLLLDFDDLVSDPAEVMRSIYGFLGLDWHAPVYAKKNVTKSKIERKLSPVLKRMGPMRRPLEQMLRRKKRLSSSQRKRIHDALKDDMKRLPQAGRWGF